MNGSLKHLFTGLLVLLTMHLLAQPTFSVSPTNTLIDEGNTFTVDITVSDFTNLASAQFPLSWNSSIISYQSISNINPSIPGLSMSSFGVPGSGNAPDDQIILSWNHPDFSGVTLTGQVVLFSVTFEGLTGGTTSLIFNPNLPQSIEILNPSGTDVGATTNNGMITVNGSGGGTGDFMLNLPNTSGNTGDQVCLPLTVTNFNDILGMQFSVNYNSSALMYTGAQNFTTLLPGFSGGSVGNPSAGNLTFTWNDPNATGASVPDGTTLVELCFDIIGSNNTTVSFSGSPTPIEVINGDEMEETFTSSNSTIVVNGGNGGGSDDLLLSLPNASGSTGDQICLPLTVTDFDDILGMQFSVNYNSSVLMYTGAQNFTTLLPGFSGGSVGNPSAGNLTFTWNDPNATGASVPDGTTLVELCFDIIGSSNTTVTFSGSPTPIEVIDGNEMEVTFTSNGSNITVGGGTGGPTELFSLPDASGNTGDQVCLPLIVNDFDNILGMQFSINYDASALMYTGAQNFTTLLSGFSGGSVGNPSAGNLTFTWNDPNATGVSVPDGTTLVELCFDIIGSSNTAVTFSGSPTPIEVIDGNEMEVTFTSNGSNITVGGGTGGPTELFNLPDASGNTGDQVCLPLIVNDFDNILGMQFSINYDASALMYTGAQNFTTLLSGFSGGSVGNPSAGNLTFTWNDPNATGVSVPDGTTLVELCFDIIGSSNTTVTFSGSPTPIEVIDGNEMEVTFTSDGSNITVGGGTGGPTELFNLPDASGNTGDQVCLPLIVNDFDNILGMQFSINYDASALMYTGAQNFTTLLSGFSGGSVGNPSAGNLTFTWNDPNATGVSVPDGTTLVELCFDIIGSTNTTVTFSGSPTPIEIIDGNEMEVTFTSSGSTITVGGGTGGPTELFNLPDANGNTGDQVCLPLIVNDFDNILGMQFSINYDASALMYTGAQNFTTLLSGFSGGSVGNPSAGNLTFTWNDPNATGISVPDGTTLVELCFDIIGSTNTTVTFSGSPTPIEIIDGNEMEVTFTSSGSTITVGGTTGPMDFLVSLPDVTGSTGDQVCLPLTVSNFDNILGMQFSVNYDPAVLMYTGAQNFTTLLSGFSGGSVGNPSAGNLTFTWNDPNATGVSLPDDTSLVELCFDIVGTSSTTTAIDFSGSPTPIEVVDGDEMNVTFTSNGGTVTVMGGAPTGFTLDLIDTPAQTGTNVCMPLTVFNFDNILGMQFSINYNADSLTYTGASNVNTQLPGFTPGGSIGNPTNMGSPSVGQLTFTWNDPNGTGASLPDDATLVELCFDINCSTNSTLTFSGSPTPIEVINGDEEEIVFNGSPGTFTFDAAPPPATITIADVSANQGETVCLPFNVTGFTDVQTMQFDIAYDATALTFDNGQNFNIGVTGFDAADITPSTGSLNIDWTGTTGATLAEGSILLELCFIANTATTSEVSFTGVPTLTTSNGGEVSTTTENGTVTVRPPVLLALADDTVMPGDMFCVPFITNSFNDVASFSSSFAYDPAVLQFDNAQNFNGSLSGYGVASFTSTSGSISTSWSAPDMTGVSLANGAVLAELCFTVLANSSTTTTIAFAETPNPIRVSNGDDDQLSVTTNGSTITITDPPGTFNLTAPGQEVCAGDDFCVDFVAGQFTFIQGMQFSMTYSATDLNFTSVSDINAGIPGLSVASFNASSGVVTLQWNGTSGVSLAPNSVLFSLCFNKLTDDPTTISVGASPVSIMITDSNGNNVNYNGGNTQLSCTPPPPLEFGQVDIVNLTCADGPIGSITIASMINGSGDYTYQWSADSGEMGNSLNNRLALTTNVTVTDNETGLSVSGTYSITSPPLLTGSVDNITNVLCAGENTGSITVSASGGVPFAGGGYNYNWSAGLPNSATQNELFPGTYSVTITDQNGCTRELINIQINELADPLTLGGTVSQIPSGGSSPGSINLEVNGGSPGYNYNWTGPEDYTFNGQDPNNITTPGEYCVTVTDAFSCTQSTCFTIYELLSIPFFNITQTCDGESTGAIDLTVAGGSCPDLSYTWNNVTTGVNFSTMQDVNNLAAGTYRIIVEDCAGNSVSANIDVTAYEPITIMGTVSNVVNLNDGSVELDVDGGNGGFTFMWNNGAMTEDIFNLAPGTYCVTVTDNVGCTTDACFPVEAAPLTPSLFNTSAPSCPGDDDACFELVMIGGVSPYNVTINDVNAGSEVTTLPAPDGQVSICILTAGTYNYEVVDANGNMYTSEEFVIIDPEPLSATATIVNDTEDAGGSGSVLLNVDGGTGSPFVLWSTGTNGLTIGQITGPTTVSYTITDDQGCELMGTATVGLLVENAVITDVDCMDSENGSINTNVSGGSEDYIYEWSAGEATAELTGLTAGAYMVTITDATGARLIRSYTINTQADFSVAASVMTNLDCFDSTNGELTASVTNNGTSTVTNYEWEDANGALVGTDQTLSNIGPGMYTVIAIDDNGCTAQSIASLESPDAIELIGAVKDLSCDGKEDGEIAVTVNGGTFPYQYAWSNGSITPLISNLAPGDYTVSVTDAKNCQVVETYTVSESTPLIVMIETEPHTDPDLCNGVARAIVMGGVGPYTYEWANIPDADEAVVTGLCHGTYFLIVTDANGCSSVEVQGEVQNDQYDCFEERVVITPDGNGSNDEFIIFCLTSVYNENELEIYNRWGQLVFQATNYDNTWEGTAQNGDDLPAGPYYWVLDYTGNNGEQDQRRGSLTIVRDN